MKLLIKFPTRQRQHRFFEAMDYLLTALRRPEDVSVLLTLDTDDEAMNNDEVRNQIAFYEDFYKVNITTVYGESKNKIHACNRDIELVEEPWDILLLFSDDMFPATIGFDKIILDKFEQLIPDTDGVLYSPDGYTPLNTLCILGKKYYDRFGYIYYPEYESFFPDNEFMEVSQLLKKELRLNKMLFRHEHPCNNAKVKSDALYERNNHTWDVDKQLYMDRRAANFNLKLEDITT
jgi:hypothetical protein